ncbi:MAG: DNA primase [Tenericutes bacterium GWC2_34_14]|nr:MAG: DNA primase [Tenericutes bacterium GWA2_35_7]OHE28402.1 MAG: DNA primase [Tenericutes bacterium GWC2_34_14]OHE33690.1 MAG: DNA primase [Tenericutes bacterium GWE2_34_108]OHE36975.1 MAG: DNA primase [Tenericutes bacterium GWF1_35_14]OHE37945.1 MAG: DNA primase [Tenericutes bacterium GWF2_35_184]OHE41122.1 MAG: DNA primase [Tenericutes bacterium RIFOXYA12_FULL_35_10]OHE43538.1 MAG: DNA primase [Tenericutes bacterium RIFOXYA2_FULL_36_32]OHE46544.1 MAG: DNA primase [Tenericutes bacterium
MDDKLIELINEKTSIVDLVSEFVSLQKRGKNFAGLCPFHQEKTPSFFVSPEKNICKCYGCGEGGSPINFLRKIKNISFEEAAHELAEKAGIEVKEKKVKKDPYETFYALMNEVASFYEFNLKHSEKGIDAVNYLYQRQLVDEQIKHFRLGLAPSFGNTIYQLLKNKGYQVSDMIKCGVVKQNDQGEYYDLFADRITFPITDPKGRVVGFSGRTMNPKETVKYMNSPETIIFKKGLLLYHFYEALPEIRKEKQVILYEGFFDVISSYAAGMKHGVATMGTSLTKEQAKLIKSVSPSLIIAYDGDSAGLKAADHAIPVLEKEGLKVEVLTIPEKMDPDDFIKSYGPEAYEKLFGEYTEDMYQFRYRYYRMGKNLSNANDLKEYKKAVMQMIQLSDPSIRAYYIQRLSTEFNIPMSELDTSKPRVVVNEPKIPTKERPKTLNRYEKAERYLILAMLKSRQYAKLAQAQLKSTDFANAITATIRLKIEHYYDEHLEFLVEDFLDTLTNEQRELMEQDILKDTLWKNGTMFDEKDIKDYIFLVLEANDKRRLDELNMRIQNIEEYNEELTKERDELLLRLRHNNKED